MKYDLNNEPIGVNSSYAVIPSENNAYSFEEFQHFIQKKENDGFKGYLFRGQRKSRDWVLEPTSARVFKMCNPHLTKSGTSHLYYEYLNEHLSQFKLSLRGRLDAEGWVWEDDNEIWAIGQHFGLHTPLLDWSSSIGVALFFAFEKPNNAQEEPTNHRCIYLWNAKYWEDLHLKTLGIEYFKKLKPTENWQTLSGSELIGRAKEIEDNPWDYWDGINGPMTEVYTNTNKIVPKLFVPKFGNNARMVNQRGVFSIWNSLLSMDDLAKSLDDYSLWENNEPYLLKVNVKDEERARIIEYLYEFNVSYLSLYPDIVGACKYQNWKFERGLQFNL